jgi:hypothetical protein
MFYRPAMRLQQQMFCNGIPYWGVRGVAVPKLSDAFSLAGVKMRVLMRTHVVRLQYRQLFLLFLPTSERTNVRVRILKKRKEETEE